MSRAVTSIQDDVKHDMPVPPLRRHVHRGGLHQVLVVLHIYVHTAAEAQARDILHATFSARAPKFDLFRRNFLQTLATH
jgi:hypothetical protein